MSISEASGRELCRAAGDVGAPKTGAGRFAHVGGGCAAIAARHVAAREARLQLEADDETGAPLALQASGGDAWLGPQQVRQVAARDVRVDEHGPGWCEIEHKLALDMDRAL